MMLAFFSACTATLQDSTIDPPLITTVDFGCDNNTDEWSMRIFTTSWTNGGDVVMATDDRIEIHGVDSIRKSPGGQQDELLMLLRIEPDPDDAKSGSASGFLCTDEIRDQLALRLAIYTYESDLEGDCWQWGEEKDFSPWGYTGCPYVEVDEDN